MPLILVKENCFKQYESRKKICGNQNRLEQKTVDFVKYKGVLNQWTSLPDPNMQSTQ